MVFGLEMDRYILGDINNIHSQRSQRN